MSQSLRHRGAALIIVLAFLVLLSALIIAFFSSVKTETLAADNYSKAVTVRQLANTATQVVTAQLADATRSRKVPGQSGQRLAWASQPGLVRTWDDTGMGWKVFKLYSARDMVADFRSDGTYSVAAELPNEVPEDWPSAPAHFTDLNAPVVVADETGLITRGGEKYRASYPIVDPLALLPTTATPPINPIDGFSITAPPGYGSAPIDPSADPAIPATAGRTGNPAPMPVRWIYVLKDGTLTVPTGSADGGRTATWDTAAAAMHPSRDNPIKGRIAFWTDDETCKLNVNTASEPTPWDTPRAVTIQDLKYGKYQPAQKEYQRFPGHSFTTALSPVFFPGIALTSSQKEDMYRFLPRVQPGGTVGATVAATGAIAPDSDRLFANVDEFLFQPAMTGDLRVENSLIDTERLRRARFFLTANSRAPELNLFGQPRITLWPIQSDSAKRTPYDKLAAFCSTTGAAPAAHPYYFQRADATSPKADYDNIPRNRELYTWLQSLTSQAIPGYGGNFKTKWGNDRDQLLTEIFDYIRCVNLRDPQSGATQFAPDGQVAPAQIGSTQGFGRFYTVSQAGFHFICSQDGPDGATDQQNPALPAGQRSIEAAFLFELFSPSLGWYKLGENLFIEVNFLTPFTVDGKDLKMTSGGRPLHNEIENGWHCNGRAHGGASGIRQIVRAFGAGNYAFAGKASPRVVVTPAANGGKMQFSGGLIGMKIYSGGSADPAKLVQTLQFNLPTGSFPVPDLVRTGTADYQSGAVDVSTTANYWWTFGNRYSQLGEVPHAPGAEYFSSQRRWTTSRNSSLPGFKMGGMFRAEDVVRTIVPQHGDLRLIAAKNSVTVSDFVRVRTTEWSDSTARFLHLFTSAAGPHMHYGFCNEPGPSPAPGIPGANADDQLVPSSSVSYHYARLPEIRPGAGKLYNQWNDYDNGIATWTDGAYINKPDEGNQSASSSPYTYFSWSFDAPTDVFFSPSRLVPSAGMLGSLPTGVKRNRPWETLLFRPEIRTDSAGKSHPGTQSPKDHLIMDLFWMPVIEPYAVSEPFSTAGKVNLNYEIAPFSYIRRATALHGVLKSEEPLALTNASAKVYKLWDHETNDSPKGLPDSADDQDPQVRADWHKLYNGEAPFDKLRRPIDAGKTLAQTDVRFARGDAFRSATEICELHLVREGETLADYESGNIWQGALITGDNTRERPYTNLYARLTTRSNTFTVHMRAQALRPSADPTVWREDSSRIAGEYRGSSLIERYIDPADPNLPDFTTTTDADADDAYRFRVLTTKQFTP